jgi:hypothetical protein
MGVRITGDWYALYDSVSMKPICGIPVFPSAAHAEDFLAYTSDRAPDLRDLTSVEAEALVARWTDERLDYDSGELLPDDVGAD